MSDLPHILYTVISFALTAVLLFVNVRKVKDPTKKNEILKASALLTVVLHYSSLYTDFFRDGSATVEKSMLLPLYPCNIAMWLLLIVAFMKDKESKVFQILSEITFYLGLVGGILGIVLNENYIATPNLADWGILKGLLSHSTMLYGCIYLLAGGYIKIGVRNMISVLIGLCGLVLDGALMIALFKAFDLEPVNCMYLLEPPFPAMPWLNVLTIGLLALALVFAVTAIYEQIALKKEDRWYYQLNEKIKEKQSKAGK